jgi:hypothetical protein
MRQIFDRPPVTRQAMIHKPLDFTLKSVIGHHAWTLFGKPRSLRRGESNHLLHTFEKISPLVRVIPYYHLGHRLAGQGFWPT